MPAHTSPLLPQALDWPSYEAARRDASLWLPAIEHIGHRHGLSGPFAPFTTGTAVVFSDEHWVIKLYPPLFAADANKEGRVLRAIDGRLGIPTPSVRAQGELEGYSYLIMRRLRGTPLDELWPTLDRSQRGSLALQLGRMVRALHSVDVRDQTDLIIDWPAFRNEMRQRAATYHSQDLDPDWCAELTRTLPSLDREPELSGEHVLLHTELGPGHVLSDGAELTGIIDVAEAMVGCREYDFAAVGLLITQGDAAAFDAFLDGYGVAPTERGDALLRRLLRHALLHRYGRLSWYLARVPPPQRTLEAAAQFWFGHQTSITPSTP